MLTQRYTTTHRQSNILDMHTPHKAGWKREREKKGREKDRRQREGEMGRERKQEHKQAVSNYHAFSKSINNSNHRLSTFLLQSITWMVPHKHLCVNNKYAHATILYQYKDQFTRNNSQVFNKKYYITVYISIFLEMFYNAILTNVYQLLGTVNNTTSL